MEYDIEALKAKINSKDTKYIVVYPDTGIDIAGFTHDLQALLTKYHTRGQGWTIGTNIEIDGVPLIDATSGNRGEYREHPGI